ncbi:MAG: chromosome partitioning protein ParB [Pseudomonadota bacterium]|nr:chromosome partitioning protein ParB [Pseudomonadota bacterium]
MGNALPIGVTPSDLRPTQMTLGFREVEVKRRQWQAAGGEDRARILRRHVVPAVIGPKNRHFIVDHHHFTKAMIDEKVALIAVFVVANLANLDKDEFWTVLDNRAWCHAYNAKGQRRELSDIPKSLKALTDDPYRSLAGELIRAGGCAKNNVPFSEFLWADFLRRRIKPSSVAADFGGALVQALDLARGQEAKSLPGWSGADPAS